MPREFTTPFQRQVIPFVLNGAGLSGAGAINIINALSLDFRYYLEKIILVTQETLVGAGGTQTYRLRKGGVAGTIVATITPTVADHAVTGVVVEASVSLTDVAAAIADADTISLTRDAGGTTITAGLMQGYIVARQRDQARL